MYSDGDADRTRPKGPDVMAALSTSVRKSQASARLFFQFPLVKKTVIAGTSFSLAATEKAANYLPIAYRCSCHQDVRRLDGRMSGGSLRGLCSNVIEEGSRQRYDRFAHDKNAWCYNIEAAWSTHDEIVCGRT